MKTENCIIAIDMDLFIKVTTTMVIMITTIITFNFINLIFIVVIIIIFIITVATVIISLNLVLDKILINFKE